MSRKKTEVVSLEQLREEELALQYDELGSDFSELNAEQELDFNLELGREYQPEVWEVENEDDTTGTQEEESV